MIFGIRKSQDVMRTIDRLAQNVGVPTEAKASCRVRRRVSQMGCPKTYPAQIENDL